jgi:hypothetical protein
MFFKFLDLLYLKVLAIFIQPYMNVFPFKRWKVILRFMEFVMSSTMPIILYGQPFLRDV